MRILPHEEWLRIRQTGIGGSDAPAVMGVTSFKSAFSLWSEKVGLIEPVDLSDNERVQWGCRQEPVIIDGYEEESARVVDRLPKYTIFLHDSGFRFCTPDALQFQSQSVVEVKNVSEYKAGDWLEEPPLEYLIQLLHNMMVLNVETGTLVALLGGNRCIWYDIDRADYGSLCFDIWWQEYLFWQMVQSEEPPEIDGSESTKTALSGVQESAEEEAHLLSVEAMEATDRIDELLETKKGVAQEIKHYKNIIRAEMGEYINAVMPDGTGWTYKQNKNGSRVLRRKQ